MKRVKEIETTKQKAIWLPQSQIDELYALAEAKGIHDARGKTSTVKDLIKELALDEADRIDFRINQNVMRYARMKIN